MRCSFRVPGRIPEVRLELVFAVGLAVVIEGLRVEADAAGCRLNHIFLDRMYLDRTPETKRQKTQPLAGVLGQQEGNQVQEIATTLCEPLCHCKSNNKADNGCDLSGSRKEYSTSAPTCQLTDSNHPLLLSTISLTH